MRLEIAASFLPLLAASRIPTQDPSVASSVSASNDNASCKRSANRFHRAKARPEPEWEFQRYHELPDELQDKILRGLSVNQQIPFKVTSKQSEKQVCNTYDECWQEAFQTLKKAFEQTSLVYPLCKCRDEDCEVD